MPLSGRYDRQIQFAPIGDDGQRQISNSCVAVLGCGALGTVAAELLVRAGIGRVRIIDRDVVEWTNLQRQSLFDETDAEEARSKAEAATERLRAINSSISIEPMVIDITPDNICDSLDATDLIVDATDNFAVRFLLNDWSLSTTTPWVHGGCVGASGQVHLFSGRGKPCFRCIVPDSPSASVVETCDTAGVLGSATHFVASLQVTEAIKWLIGERDSVRKGLLSVDLWNNRTRELSLSAFAEEGCPTCRTRDFEFLNGDRGQSADSVICGRDAVQLNATSSENIDLKQVALVGFNRRGSLFGCFLTSSEV